MLRIGFGELDDEREPVCGRRDTARSSPAPSSARCPPDDSSPPAREGCRTRPLLGLLAWPALACRTPRTSRYNVSSVWAVTSERRVPASSHCPADARKSTPNCSLEACVGSTSQRRRAKRSAQILSRDRCAIWAACSSSRASVAAAMAAFTSTPSSTKPANSTLRGGADDRRQRPGFSSGRRHALTASCIAFSSPK